MSDALPIRAAATLLLVRDDPFEVLMVRRSATGSFPSAMVFPGGTVDAEDYDSAWMALTIGGEGLTDDERALRIAGFRETFEEVGLLLAVDAEGDPVAPAAGAASGFREVVEASGGRLPMDALVPFARWITPAGRGRRFDVHFFLCVAPAGQVAVCDGPEIIAPEWIAPGDAIALSERGERDVVFPTRLNLLRLDESSSVSDALAAAQDRPSYTVRARLENRADGVYSVVGAEAGYPETEGRIGPLPLA
jgi:8-oxo-dGTP pyrophosphatase MutT (NUDIX family)